MSNLICQIPVHDRPRERFERLGADGLTDAELLAILLRTGCQGSSAVEVGRKLLEHFGGLEELGRRSIAEIASVKGVGKIKAIQLKTAFAVHDRIIQQAMDRVVLDKPGRIYDYMVEKVRFDSVEVLYGLALDSKLKLIRRYEVSRGLANQTLVHAREVYREAISSAAVHLVLVHNHPSGDPHPSSEDIRSTRELSEAGRVLGIPLLDHLIMGRPQKSHPCGYVSLKEMGLMG